MVNNATLIFRMLTMGSFLSTSNGQDENSIGSLTLPSIEDNDPARPNSICTSPQQEEKKTSVLGAMINKIKREKTKTRLQHSQSTVFITEGEAAAKAHKKKKRVKKLKNLNDDNKQSDTESQASDSESTTNQMRRAESESSLSSYYQEDQPVLNSLVSNFGKLGPIDEKTPMHMLETFEE